MNYEYRTQPFAHQRELFERTALEANYGLFWEQGTGKTKAVIDTSAHLFELGQIDTLLVLAPNGVHRNWITDEVPVHMPKRLAPQIRMGFWESSKSSTLRHEQMARGLVQHKGFMLVAMNYDAMMTKKGVDFLSEVVRKRKVLLVFDESHYLKTPGAKRTKRAIALARHAKFRRILTGTPIANSPFDAYSQLKCLDETFWKAFGFGAFTDFKTHFGIFVKGHNGQQGRDFEQCVGYKNLDQLRDFIAPVTSRVTKDEVLDLPPKLFQKRYFDMSPEQVRVYKEIKQDAIALLTSGETVTAPLAITQLLRLQQVTCGYVPTDEGGEFETFGGANPRLDLLCEVCDTLPHAAIIWARFRRDIDLIMEQLGDQAVRYDGNTSDSERAEAKARFQVGKAKFFVGNPAAGATGLTLTAARYVIYYSNSFKLTDRLQSEDRAHRIGQEHPVTYIDITAPGTVDDKIVMALRSKMDIASELTGDKLKEWVI